MTSLELYYANERSWKKLITATTNAQGSIVTGRAAAALLQQSSRMKETKEKQAKRVVGRKNKH